MKKYFLLIFCPVLFSLMSVRAQNVDWTWWNEMADWDGYTSWQNYFTYSTAYFGPNAFPVPEIGDGKVPAELQLDLSAGQYWGFGDNATDFSFRLDIPVCPEKVVFSAWMVPIEYYKTTIHVRNERYARKEYPEGVAVGDLYLQTGIQLVRNHLVLPDIRFNVTLKTASGGPLTDCRYYDTPGYYFDFNIGKKWTFPEGKLIHSLIVSEMAGFLCWQAMQGFQDDAFLYGIKIDVASAKCHFEIDWSGYVGWAQPGDKPMIVRAKVSREFKKIHLLYISGLVGIVDYPFYCLRLGYKLKIPCLFGLCKK